MMTLRCDLCGREVKMASRFAESPSYQTWAIELRTDALGSGLAPPQGEERFDVCPECQRYLHEIGINFILGLAANNTRAFLQSACKEQRGKSPPSAETEEKRSAGERMWNGIMETAQWIRDSISQDNMDAGTNSNSTPAS